jgi:hypothetical protein
MSIPRAVAVSDSPSRLTAFPLQAEAHIFEKMHDTLGVLCLLEVRNKAPTWPRFSFRV